MAYTDKKGLTSGQMWALILVILVHIIIIYGFITGLAFSVIKQVAGKTEVFNVAKPPPPPPPPPPPDPTVREKPAAQTDIYAPPDPNLQSDNTATTTTTYTPPSPPATPGPVPATPPPPPPPAVPSTRPKPKNNPSGWVTTEDYPSSSLRNGEEGTTRFTVNVDASGKVTACNVTGSSGHPKLDEAACQYVTRRARFTSATEGGNPVAGTYSHSVRWQIPEE